MKINGKPILERIMSHFDKYGHKKFLLLVGYKSDKIIEYFKDSEFDILFSDAGENATKGDRIRKAYKDDLLDETFILSYGDDVSDVDIDKLVDFHNNVGSLVTVTVVPLVSPFGVVKLFGNHIKDLEEKPKLDYWINGGYMVMERMAIGYMDEDETDMIKKLAKEGGVAGFRHTGFWKSVNTMKDYEELKKIERGRK